MYGEEGERGGREREREREGGGEGKRERERERAMGERGKNSCRFFRNGVVNMMSNALYKMLANKTGAEDVVIATYIMPMPSKGMNITIDITTLIGGVLFPFAFSFLIPVSLVQQ